MVGAVTKFAISGFVGLVVVGLAEAWLLQRQGVDVAVQDARTATELLGHGLVEPALVSGVTRGDPAGLANLDGIVRERLLKDPIIRVKLWTADGRVFYSDEPRLIGAVFPLAEDDLAALNGGPAAADVSDLSRDENKYERDQKRLLQVYMGLRTQDGEPVLFEAYLKGSSITNHGTHIWRVFIPLMLGSLVVLELVQLPLAWSMGRKLWRGQKDRMALFQHALEASDVERRRIAGAIHDGVVQKLTGLSYSLQAKAERLGSEATASPSDLAAVLRQAAVDTRENVQDLRGALVDIYPPDPQHAGLTAVLSDLFVPLTTQGVETRLNVAPALNLSPELEALIFRASREMLANVIKHANARSVEERITVENGRVIVVIEDDGRGFSVADLKRQQSEGHMGIRLISDLVSHAGGSFNVNAQPGMGTRIRIEVPLA